MKPFKQKVIFEDGSVIVTGLKLLDGEEIVRVDIHADRTNMQLSNITGTTNQAGVPFEGQLLTIAVRKVKETPKCPQKTTI